MAKVFYEVVGHWENQECEVYKVFTYEDAKEIAIGLRTSGANASIFEVKEPTLKGEKE